MPLYDQDTERGIWYKAIRHVVQFTEINNDFWIKWLSFQMLKLAWCSLAIPDQGTQPRYFIQSVGSTLRSCQRSLHLGCASYQMAADLMQRFVESTTMVQPNLPLQWDVSSIHISRRYYTLLRSRYLPPVIPVLRWGGSKIDSVSSAKK